MSPLSHYFSAYPIEMFLAMSAAAIFLLVFIFYVAIPILAYLTIGVVTIVVVLLAVSVTRFAQAIFWSMRRGVFGASSTANKVLISLRRKHLSRDLAIPKKTNIIDFANFARRKRTSKGVGVINN